MINVSLFSIKRLRIHLEMKHHELSRDQVKSQLAALRTRRAKTGAIQLLFHFLFTVMSVS